jgi:hypothetical protein
MKNLTKLVFAIIFAAILFTACSTEDNPLGPTDPGNGGGDPDPIVIKTPRYMRIESITDFLKTNQTEIPGTGSRLNQRKNPI